MKKFTRVYIIVFALAMFVFSFSAVKAVNVTFRVDMTYQTVSPLGVHVAGNFQGWNPAATLMTHTGSNIYEVTIDLAVGFAAQYKFVNGNAWGMDESVPAGCATGGNRYFTVPSSPLILPAVCYASCNPCLNNKNVTFRVDMSEQTVGPTGVFLAGTMNNWNSTSQPMTHAGNNIYTITKSLPVGETVQYKFINSGTWEQVPGGCATGGNRYFTIPDANTILPAVCFGSCVECVVPMVNITFQVDMTYESISPNGVHIAGSFQGWDPASSLMTLVSGKVYAATFSLEAGNSYEYKFINGNAWGNEEIVPAECSVNTNRVIVVPSVNTTMAPICFAMCDACPPPVDVSITFQVDMSEQVVSPNGVHIAGTINNYNPASTALTNQGNNIYSVTLTLTQGNNHLYRFVNGNTNAGLESVPSSCAQNGQRHFTVPGVNTMLDIVCFSACEACVPPPIVDVTFRVDMSDQVVSADGVHLVGSFQAWNLTGTPMTLAGDGIYTVTLPLVAGDHHTYKFINGISWDFSEAVPPECGEDNGFGGYNRFIDVPGVNTTLDAVCFSSCAVCPPPAQVDIIFQVDMSKQTVSPNGVHLAGSFQGWNYGSTPMTLVGNNIYQATVNLTEGTYQTYRFVNGNVKANAEIVPVACAVGNPFTGYTRPLTVPAVNTTLDLVCFAQCEPCVPPARADVTFRVDMNGVFVSPDGVHLAGSFQEWNTASTLMTDQGNGIYSVTVNLLAGEAIEYKFINGISWGQDEIVPAECSLNGNRYLTVPEVNTVLDAVCYGSCSACPPLVAVTFQVDMAYETVAPEGVHIAGSFQGWNPGSTAMTLAHDAIYTYSTSLPQGYYYEYKFVNGNNWDAVEIVPAGCALNINRFLTIPAEAVVLDPICFGSCAICAPPTVEVTFQVDMTNEPPSPDGVHIAGSFQGWDPASTAMTDAGNNIYTYTTSLNIGEYYEFKYINGTTWDGDEIVPAECNMNGNRYLTVPETSTILPSVCYAGCGSCPLLAWVKFSVDMSLETVSPDGVHITGDFESWDPGAIALSDDGNGIYSVTILMVAGSYQTYKFINGNTFEGAEIVPFECGVDDGFGGFKRYLTVPDVDTDLDIVCFSGCTICSPPMVDVTFQVDMTNEPPSPDGVYLVGSFQGWILPANLMTLVSDNIYSCTVALPVGTYQEYKFVNGIEWTGAEIVPAECCNVNGNRYLTVPETPTTLPSVCFAQCGSCPLLAWIKFSVDMSLESVSPDGIHIAGDFESWDPGAIALSDDGNGIYSVTILMVAGSYQTYKFINGNTFDGAEIVPAECGVDDGFGGYKRYLTVPMVDTDLDVVCFSKCSGCYIQHDIIIPAGWTSLSSYVMPTETDIETLLSDIFPELVVLQNMTQVYYPAGGVNTIGTWASQSAYKIKVQEQVTLTIVGLPEQNKTLELAEGWNLIPVISDQPVDVLTLFGEVGDNVIVIKSIADVGVYWPEYDINTLITFQPGKAYFVKMSAPGSVTFP